MRHIRVIIAAAVLCLAAEARAQSPTNVFGIDFTASNSQAVSASGHLRLRYNSATGALEQSIAGAAYASVSTVETLAQTYAVGAATTDSIMLLTAAGGPIVIRNNATPLATMFQITDSTGTSVFVNIKATAAQTFRSGVADGASAVAFQLDTINALANAGARILQLTTAGGSALFSWSPTTMFFGANNGATALAGTGAFDLSLATGIFKTSTGAHTFGSASWAVPANLVVTGGSSATNTTGVLITPNVADGASSVMFRVNNSVALANASASYFQLAANSVLRSNFIPSNTDGFRVQDGGGTSFMSLSTNAGSLFGYGGATYSAGSGSITMGDGSGQVSMSGATLTLTIVSGIPDATGTRDWGTAAKLWRVVGGSQLLAQAIAAQTTPIQTWADSAGTKHSGTDSEGLPSLGGYLRFQEHWCWTTTVAPTSPMVNSAGVWTYANTTSTGAGSGFAVVSGVSFTCALLINPGTVNGSSGDVTGPGVNAGAFTNLYIVHEWPGRLSLIGANNATYVMGAANGNLATAANPNGWWFSKTSAQTNWQCNTDDGVTTSGPTDTGVPPVANVYQMFRIEFYGAGTPLGAKTVKFYIDGTLISGCTKTANVGATSEFPQFGVKLTNTASAQTMSIGPMLQIYNEVATLPFQ